MSDDGKAMIAEFHLEADGALRLFNLYTGDEHGIHTYWDVDWCKRDLCYLFHMSGWGRFKPTVSGIFWAIPKLKVKTARSRIIDKAARERNKTRRLKEAPAEFEGMDILEWLQQNASDEQSVYCSECEDWLPGDNLCVHCWWCDEGGWYSTPSERMTVCDGDYCGCRSLDVCAECGNPNVAHGRNILQMCPERKTSFRAVEKAGSK